MTKEEARRLVNSKSVDSTISTEVVVSIIDKIFENNLSCSVMVDIKTTKKSA